MIDIIIDCETFGSTSKAALIDFSILAFDSDPEVVQSFDELTKNALRVKFKLAEQKGHRTFSKSTIEWWKNQSAEARLNLAPTAEDVSTLDGIKRMLDFCREKGVDPWKSQMWCRGMSFDFPIFTDLIRDLYRHDGVPEEEIDTFKLEPVKFWNQRDIRTAIEAYSLTRELSTTPLPKGVLDGFIAHDSIHDCAKDVLMLKYAQRYALSLEDVPSEEDTDPLSLPTKR